MNPLLADIWHATTLLALSMKPVYGFLLAVIAIFIILLVLVQRGRGGGLAGALGGVGGSSAFGAKAGDVFTRITIGAAAVWIVVCIAAAKWGDDGESLVGDFGAKTSNSAPAESGAPAGDSAESGGETSDATQSGSDAAATEGADTDASDKAAE